MLDEMESRFVLASEFYFVTTKQGEAGVMYKMQV